MGADHELSEEDLSEEETSELEEKHAEHDECRFSHEEMDEFNNSNEGKGLITSFFLCSLFYMWPYQTLLQTQNFLVAQFPEKRDSVGFIMMLCTTWPLLISSTFLDLSSVAQKLSYKVRMTAPPLLVVFVALYLITIMATTTNKDLLLYSLYGAACVVSIAESITEPATYDMAGLMPSALTSQAIQAGNGACGVIVCLVQLLTRLAFNGFGTIGQKQLEVLTYVFFVLMALSGVLLALVYKWRSEPSDFYQEYVEQKDIEDDSDEQMRRHLTTGKARTLHAHHHRHHRSTKDEHAEEDEETAMESICKALTYVWPSVLAVAITFGTTLVLWPVIPGLTCVSEPHEDHTLQTWWFDITLLAFNVADLIGKFERRTLNWGAAVLPPSTQLALSVLRAALFAPLFLTASAPQMYSPTVAKYVTLASVFFLGLSNGWLSTICFMRAPKGLPAGVSTHVVEQASTVLVIGLFCVLSGGCTLGYFLGQTILKPHLGQCYEAA